MKLYIVLTKDEIRFPDEPIQKGGTCAEKAFIETQLERFGNWITNIAKNKRWVSQHNFLLTNH